MLFPDNNFGFYGMRFATEVQVKAKELGYKVTKFVVSDADELFILKQMVYADPGRWHIDKLSKALVIDGIPVQVTKKLPQGRTLVRLERLDATEQ